MLSVWQFADLKSGAADFHVGAGRALYEHVSLLMLHADWKVNDLILQADGDELEKIKQEFTGIPMHKGRVVRWSGETAYFIVQNLKL